MEKKFENYLLLFVVFIIFHARTRVREFYSEIIP
jgi:hypothetical protein